MNILKRAFIWLLTKHEKKTMTDQVLDVSAQPQPVAENTEPAAQVQTETKEPGQDEQAAQEQPSPFAALKASFEAKIQFIESGIATLGSDAEKELVALAEKYL
ncbi:hypothetical protein [Mangrovibacter phragmitis]|uniref:hypothetical protein n=1 Tax=Mangrovibacter phragmitis TaxID=1691903 RepID=UPI00336A9AA4